jgi:hypothetical protein
MLRTLPSLDDYEVDEPLLLLLLLLLPHAVSIEATIAAVIKTHNAFFLITFTS